MIPQTPIPMEERAMMSRGTVRPREDSGISEKAAEEMRAEAADEEERPKEKRQRKDERRAIGLSQDESPGARPKRTLERDFDEVAEGETSPKKERTGSARDEQRDVQRVELEAHGNEDEADWWEFIPQEDEEEEEKLRNEGWQGDEEGHPPDVGEEVLRKLDEQAEDEEIRRLLAIPVMTRISDAEAESYNMLSTRMVKVWKRRQEKHG